MMEAFEKTNLFLDCFTDDQIAQSCKYGNIEQGDWLNIYWKDEDYKYTNPDKCYVIALPSSDPDMGNLIVHVPYIYGEKGEHNEEWIHLIDLCTNNMIEKIEVIKFR